MNSNNIILTTALLWPFAGFAVSLLVPSRAEKGLAQWAFTTLISHAAMLLALSVSWFGQSEPALQLREITLYRHDDYGFFIDVYFDYISATFLWTGTLIAGMVVYYSGFYMHREWGYKRFFNTLLFFYAAYVFVILAGNFETLFLGWEFIGLSSFLLVAFYRLRYIPVRNAVRVYTIYRLGDVGLLMAMWMSHHFWHANITFAELAQHEWSDVYFEHHHQTALFVSLMVLLAALAKSAQFPFSSWLPRAMEGPTPSSAVFYGSLSVHLGAYLLMRTHTFWEMLPEVKVLIGFLGLTTAVSGTLISRTQSTIKGQIAYSSSAQIGMMFMEIALGLHSLVLIHFVGNALLRTYQLLVSPSVVTYLIRDQFFHFEPKPVAPAKSRWVHRLKSSLYLLSLKEWNLDHLVFSVLLYPLKRLKKILNPIPNPLFLLMTTMIMLLSTFWLPFEKAEWAGVDNEFARSATSTVLGIWAMLLMVKAYNERGSVFYGWTWILLGNLLVLRSTQWRVEINNTEAALFLGGIILSSSVGYAVLLILCAQLKQMPDLNAYWGLIHTKPALGFFFLMSGLGMSGFPITTTFLGQDLLLSHIEEGDFVMATLLALSFVLNGISIIRMYARVFLGHHQKSYLHPTPQTL